VKRGKSAMPAGVEGFIPGRLTMAREARALRKRDFAALIDRSDATVSKYESEDRPQRPDAAVLPRMAEVLGVEISWFFKPLPRRIDTTVFYRSLISELGLMRDKARARLDFVESIEQVVSEHVEFPELDVPDLLDGRPYASLRRDDFDHYARALRDQWELGDGPIDDLLLVIENAGIIVAEDEIGSVKLDGVSRWSTVTGRPYMLVAVDKNVAVRRRLDAAHELAHLTLHRHVSPEDHTRNFRLIEEQAMAFAGAFLLPADTFGDEIYSHSLEALLSLKTKWKVSVGAMIKRLVNMDIISEEYERRLWQYYSYRRWRTREPFDDKLPVEQPQQLRGAIELIIDEGVLSRRELLREIGLSASDVCALSGLPGTFFDETSENVVRLKPVKRSSDGDKGGSIVPFSGRKR
jgi:Zn-dependent peptidase ImmA (M78 family)/transcriptional regulator with XRE-family HTH domain